MSEGYVISGSERGASIDGDRHYVGCVGRGTGMGCEEDVGEVNFEWPYDQNEEKGQ
jgi:hypothetical protein